MLAKKRKRSVRADKRKKCLKPLLFIPSLIIVLDTSVFQNVNVLVGHMSYCVKISG